MNKPTVLKKGDKVAIVSLSSGILGEPFCAHTLKIAKQRLVEFGLVPVFMPNSLKGVDYLKSHPEERAKDIKTAFMDDSIAGIICAIGGDDTYKTLPFLLEDVEFISKVKSSPKIFTGFSDTTVNHLMFYKLGMNSFYGPNVICDLGELDNEMLPFTKKAFSSYFTGVVEIYSSDIWYEERKDFSEKQVGLPRNKHKETRNFEVLQGEDIARGKLLGGCLESIYEILTGHRYEDEKEICAKYKILPVAEEWKNKILFIETCEEKPTPEIFKQELYELKKNKILDYVEGILVGKPQDEKYYEEYKEILLQVVDNKKLPIIYNVNFGHAFPRCVIPYGIEAEICLKDKSIRLLEKVFV